MSAAILQSLPIAEKWKGRKPLRPLAREVPCSYHFLKRMADRAELETLDGPNGLESTLELVLIAMERRAARKRAERGGESPSATVQTIGRSSEDRAHEAAAALGWDIRREA